MGVGASSDHSLSSCLESSCDGSGVSNDLLTVCTELWCSNLLKLHGKTTNLMVVRATLEHGEDCKVNSIEKFFLAENDARSGTSKTLMSSRCHNIAMLEWIAHALSCNKSTDMGDISHKISSYTICDFSISCVIEVSRIATSTTEQYVRPELGDCSCESVHIDQTCLCIYVVWLGDEVMATSGNLFGLSLMTMSEMTSMSQCKAHNTGARL